MNGEQFIEKLARLERSLSRALIDLDAEEGLTPAAEHAVHAACAAMKAAAAAERDWLDDDPSEVEEFKEG